MIKSENKEAVSMSQHYPGYCCMYCANPSKMAKKFKRRKSRYKSKSLQSLRLGYKEPKEFIVSAMF